MIYSKLTFAVFQGECKDKSGGKDKPKDKGKDHKMKDKKKKEKKEGKKSGDSSSSSSDGVGPMRRFTLRDLLLIKYLT